MKIIRFLGSLSFAIALLVALVAVLTASTLMESAYGTPFVQKLFYSARWFDVFLALVAVNILFSALSRWPYQRHHTGFLVTHVGILLLLAGSLMTRLSGVEGQMALREGEQKNHILGQEYELVVHEPARTVRVWELKSLPAKGRTPLPLGDPARQLTLDRLEQNVQFTSNIKPAEASRAEVNHAVRFTLQSQMAKLNESFWLIENSPDPSLSRHLSIGLAEIELKEGRPRAAGSATKDVAPQLKLVRKSTGQSFIVKLLPGLNADSVFKEAGVTLSEITYYPDARVNEENELVNASDVPRNPAVRFTLDDGKGHREKRALFTLFPDFESMHGRKSEAFADLQPSLLAPESQLTVPGSGLTFYFSDLGWTYEARSKSGVLSGDLKVGQDLPTGWMDFRFRVDELIDRAVVEKELKPDPSMKNGDVGVQLTLSSHGKRETKWAMPDSPATFETAEGPLTAAVGPRSSHLPFRLQLIDFRKKNYPGTENAASYESDVMLEDTDARVKIQQTIWMNHPLDYKGYRIFQSSYIEDPEHGDTSIFTIAKNPGIGLIYAGAIVMFLGIICVFYIKPLSYLSARSSHARAKK